MTRDVKEIFIYDTTLRDGSQGEGISYTLEDKLKIVKKLDSFGVDYIEAGNPGSNPKDLDFFKEVAKCDIKSKLVAFGSTRRVGVKVEEDMGIKSLLFANTPAVAIFGKSWDLHVTDIIRTTLDENLSMIEDTVKYMKSMGKEVIFDAEHFFDGYKNNREYAIESLKSAAKAGADFAVLCDTNGGTMPWEIENIINDVLQNVNVNIGIHCHNDTGMAVANSVVAAKCGAVQIQGTINGYGERCGNANLITIIGNLEVKLGKKCLDNNSISELTNVSKTVAEIANMTHEKSYPYVGASAFAHKGGMHIDGVNKNSISFEHINPEIVGNERRFLMSEVSGKSTILSSIQKIIPEIKKDSKEAQEMVDILKKLEYEGYQFEGAESSFELLIRKHLGKTKEFFKVIDFRVIEEAAGIKSAYAMIKLEVDGKEEITAADGAGPVNAMDKALRKALTVFYPELKDIRLTDYKVRVLDPDKATGAKVRVHIETSDGEATWGTVGVSTNIIEASWKALLDSIDYFLYKEIDRK
ncbi:citramalate synthase [Clostridium cylindrosporum]|uniref:Citramalate synthase n=1 Tax=Clostridium cylindrosporum DSM 605 TaxID=1121307 RepID=A0A0J8D5S2_CLOCY|nr:citramalate synthase [Clostridium cylindrosporum]KMT21202.1 2-isopropylmalate synthase/homocitrate synthase family protein [Clostridium cylindrosporum DSM 605]